MYHDEKSFLFGCIALMNSTKVSSCPLVPKKHTININKSISIYEPIYEWMCIYLLFDFSQENFW